MGDMFYMVGGVKIICCYGFFVSDEEVEEIVNYFKFFGELEYVGGVVDGFVEEKVDNIDVVFGFGGNINGEDVFYD